MGDLNDQTWNRVASSAVHEAGQVMERRFFGEDTSTEQFLEQISEQLREAESLEDEWARGFTRGALNGSQSVVTSFSQELGGSEAYDTPKLAADNRAEVVGIHLAHLRLSRAQWADYCASPIHMQDEPISLRLALDKGEDYALDRAQSVLRIRLERRLEDCYRWARGRDPMMFNALAWIALYTPRPGGLPDDFGHYSSVVESIKNDELITEEPQRGGFSEVYLSSRGIARLRELGSELFQAQPGMPMLKQEYSRYS